MKMINRRREYNSSRCSGKYYYRRPYEVGYLNVNIECLSPALEYSMSKKYCSFSQLSNHAPSSFSLREYNSISIRLWKYSEICYNRFLKK